MPPIINFHGLQHHNGWKSRTSFESSDQHVDCVTVVHVDACPERSIRTRTCARRMPTAKIWKRN